MLFVVVHVGSDKAGAEMVVGVDAAEMGAAVPQVWCEVW